MKHFDIKDLSSTEIRIGWIGTGVMGLSMCRHIMDRGYRVTVYNRTREKAKALLDCGARWAASPKEAAASSDVVLTMVGFPGDVLTEYDRYFHFF